MSLIPGYDFAEQEYVTPELLLRWILGATVYPATSQSAQAGGLAFQTTATGETAVSLSQEGQLFFNIQTGHLCVQTRWGQVPVLGGDCIFTKRFRSNTTAYGETAQPGRYFGPATIGGAVPGVPSTSASCSPADMLNNWEQSTILNAQAGGTYYCYNLVLGPAVIWPTLESSGAPDALTEATQTGENRRLLCLRGWTPAWLRPFGVSYMSSMTCTNLTTDDRHFKFYSAGGGATTPQKLSSLVREPKSWNTPHNYSESFMCYVRPHAGPDAPGAIQTMRPSWVV